MDNGGQPEYRLPQMAVFDIDGTITDYLYGKDRIKYVDTPEDLGNFLQTL